MHDGLVIDRLTGLSRLLERLQRLALLRQVSLRNLVAFLRWLELSCWVAFLRVLKLKRSR